MLELNTLRVGAPGEELSLVQALEQLPGVEDIDLAARGAVMAEMASGSRAP
jgi:hypothetical protein